MTRKRQGRDRRNPRPAARPPARPLSKDEKRAAALAAAEALERSLARRVFAWAETWKRCPLNACRRRGGCADLDTCRGIDRTPGPVTFTPEAQRAIRAALDRACGRAPLYDPAPERDAALPPGPSADGKAADGAAADPAPTA